MTQATPRTSDLGVRVVSAVVMIVVAGIALWLGGLWWSSFVAIVAIVCIGEFVRLIWLGTKNWFVRSGGSLAALLYVGLAAHFLGSMPLGIIDHGPDNLGSVTGAILVLTVLGFVVCTDVGAYVVGRTVGGPKIAPKISPSKTWAGLFGGMTAAGLWGLAALYFPQKLPGIAEGPTIPVSSYWFAAIASGAALAIFSQAGDFFESWLKRRAGVKDSSTLIPGHGGVFDRADGLIPVIIVCGFAGDWLIFGYWVWS